MCQYKYTNYNYRHANFLSPDMSICPPPPPMYSFGTMLFKRDTFYKSKTLILIYFYIFENSQNCPFQKIRETGSGKAQKPIE